MRKIRYVIAPAAACLVLLAPGCKKSGKAPASGPAKTASAAKADKSAKVAEKAAKAAKQADASKEKTKKKGLGPGTDAQRSLLARAKKAFLTDKTDQAEVLFEKLSHTGPLSGPQVSGIIALAQIYNESDRSQKALALYDGLADKVDGIPEVQLVIARAYARQGESTRAIAAYKKLLKVQPDYVFAWTELGKLYAGAGRKDDASKAFYKYEQRVYSLAKKLESSDTPAADRLHILDVFSLVSDDRATQATVKALGAKSPDVREKAAVVLGETGAVEARKQLKDLSISDPNPAVRIAAKGAVKSLDKLGVKTPDGPIGPKVVKDKKDLPVKK